MNSGDGENMLLYDGCFIKPDDNGQPFQSLEGGIYGLIYSAPWSRCPTRKAGFTVALCCQAGLQCLCKLANLLRWELGYLHKLSSPRTSQVSLSRANVSQLLLAESILLQYRNHNAQMSASFYQPTHHIGLDGLSHGLLYAC